MLKREAKRNMLAHDNKQPGDGKAGETAGFGKKAGRNILWEFRRTWPQLLVTDVLAKGAGFVLLTPLVAVLLHIFLTGADNRVLTNEGILFFFLRPAGLVLLILVGVIWAGIVFAEQASLMAVCLGTAENRRVTWGQALRYSARHAAAMTRLAGRVAVKSLLLALPFLAAAGGVFFAFLTDHDINYYLTQKPPVLWVAALLIGGILLGLLVLLARLALGWTFALPILLFEESGPKEALRSSQTRTRGRRWTIALWFAGWAALSIAASVLFTWIVGFAGRFLIPTQSGSLLLVAGTVGAVFILSSLGNLAISFLAAVFFALLVVRLYRAWGGRGGLKNRSIAPVGSLAGEPAWRIRRWTVLWGSLAAAAAVAVTAVILVHSIPVDARIEVVAHRGGAGVAPENTLAAMDRAIADHADWVEIDVQETADGRVVVAHDMDLMRVSRVGLKIGEATYAELEKVDIGSFFAPEFKDQRVPTLRQVLDACRGKTGVIIELKYYGYNKHLEQRVVEIVEATGMVSQIAIMSLKYEGILRTKALRPDWTYGFLSGLAVGDLTALDVDFLAVTAGLATRRLIRTAHRRGKKVYVWTVNDPVRMSVMIDRGVDGIITDQAALAESLLARRARMTSVQRFVVGIAARLGLLRGMEQSSDVSDA
ncbi:MAG: glycerophosphoryl diester phosphodiesterase membrane domain-containing protein [Deltaproteobacteria bacterium]|nr:glycerophosphoryl diester phosphodiesterase membrane domain-containing protein [Deltaproteobacteria bacterium]